MNSRHLDEDSPQQPEDARESREELQREQQLVRSAGTISKPAMALAFGLVFLLAAAAVFAQSRRWPLAALLAVLGAASCGWAVLAWMRGRAQRRS